MIKRDPGGRKARLFLNFMFLLWLWFQSPAILHVGQSRRRFRMCMSCHFGPASSTSHCFFHDFSSCFFIVVMKNVKTSMLLKASHAKAMRIWSWSRRNREPKPSSAWISHCPCSCPLPMAPCKSPKYDFEHEISTAEKPSHAQEGKYVSIFRISIFLRWFCLKSYKNARFLAFPMQKPWHFGSEILAAEKPSKVQMDQPPLKSCKT